MPHSFFAQEKENNMSLRELSNYTITAKYAKYLPEHKRRESWGEIVDRSRDMHLRKFADLDEALKEDIRWAFELVREKKVLPSMRGMQFGGEGVERKNERLYNCCFLHIYNTRAIEKAFYLLLCGVGCGFGLGKKWVAQFPKVVKPTGERHLRHVVEDSIEGWATSTKILVDSYLEGNEYSGVTVHFDYSQVRPKGAPLSHGGKAPGSAGLRHAHLEIEKLLNRADHKLRTIDVYDILMHVADSVLSGGIRRAACIALFDKDDRLMMDAKTGTWFVDNPQRARSNNTVLLKRDETSVEDFNYILQRSKEFGEPGFAFVNDENTGLNPCAEIAFLPFQDGEPCVQMCNLTTINGNKVETEEDLKEFVKAATIIGTLQASYTDFKFLDEKDIKMTEEEALLGVSILGFLSNPSVLLDEGVMQRCSSFAVSVNEEWAGHLGINPASRVTCVKPDGSSSCVLESPFSGIHPAHHYKYFRRVQTNKEESVYRHFKEHNPHLCEESIYSATNTDDVISFPIALPDTRGIIKDQLDAITHLDLIKKVQKNWVETGEKNNKKPVSHSVSCTVLVGEDEWESVAKYLYENRENFTAVSLLARTGDKTYKQAPYEALKTPEDYHVWNSMKFDMKPVDYSLMLEEEDNTTRSEELACVGGVCTL